MYFQRRLLLCFTRTRWSYSISTLLAHPMWFQLLCNSSWASSAPTLPTLSPRTPALPILLTLPVLLALPLGHLPCQPSPSQDTCCFLLESSSLHAWWACWLPGLMLNVTALQLSFYFLPLSLSKAASVELCSVFSAPSECR